MPVLSTMGAVFAAQFIAGSDLRPRFAFERYGAMSNSMPFGIGSATPTGPIKERTM
jgi:hypothetical protein